MRHFASFTLFALIAALIIIQRDVDGQALVAGWKGLHLAVWGCVAGMVWSLAGAARVMLTLER